jgi:hypothetical protein
VVDGVAERRSIPDGGADAMAACIVLCSVSDLDAGLPEICRALALGGALAVLDQCGADGWAWPSPGCGCATVAANWRRLQPQPQDRGSDQVDSFDCDCLGRLWPLPSVSVMVPFVLRRAHESAHHAAADSEERDAVRADAKRAAETWFLNGSLIHQ